MDPQSYMIWVQRISRIAHMVDPTVQSGEGSTGPLDPTVDALIKTDKNALVGGPTPYFCMAERKRIQNDREKTGCGAL